MEGVKRRGKAVVIHSYLTLTTVYFFSHTVKYILTPQSKLGTIFNPRRACARVTVVVLCVCQCVSVSVCSRSSCFSVR